MIDSGGTDDSEDASSSSEEIALSVSDVSVLDEVSIVEDVSVSEWGSDEVSELIIPQAVKVKTSTAHIMNIAIFLSNFIAPAFVGLSLT